MLATVTSLGLQGLYCYRVTVEADLVEEGHGFEIVGLPGAAVKESRERVRASLRNGDLSYPDGRITVNLAPADTAKDSPIYDLPVLLALLRAGDLLPEQPQEYAFVGELSMSGELRPAKGVLPMARACAAMGITRLYVPQVNAAEAALAGDVEVVGVSNVQELLELLNGHRPTSSSRRSGSPMSKFGRLARLFGGARAGACKARAGNCGGRRT